MNIPSIDRAASEERTDMTEQTEGANRMSENCEKLHGTEPHEHCPVCGDIKHSGVPLSCGLRLGR